MIPQGSNTTTKEITLVSKTGERVVASLTFTSILPKGFWEERHVLHPGKMTSAGVRTGMSDTDRQALISKLQKAMAVMHDNVEEWIPDGVEMDKTGKVISVNFNFLAAEIETEVNLLAQATTFEIEDTKRKTSELAAEVEELKKA